MEPRSDHRAEAAAQAQAHLGHPTRLQYDGHVRDLAMFNVAIDSKLRGCDLVKLRVADIHLGDGVRLRTTVVQQNTGRPVPFELTKPTRKP